MPTKKLKLPTEKRIALYERLARTGLERSQAVAEKFPALAAYYADLALHYDKVARRLEQDFKDSAERPSSGS